MKNLQLHKKEHQRLLKGFSEWLSLQGYAAQTVYNLPIYTKEFLHYLEHENIDLSQLTAEMIQGYFFHLRVRPKCKGGGKTRKKQRGNGVLSLNSLINHRRGLLQFSKYLKETDQYYFQVDVPLEKIERKIKTILTTTEIKSLYEICEHSPLGLRDRAMLSIYYGLGLRRTEGVSLDVSDYMPEKNMLYVRKGKNYKERYVPITEEIKEDLEGYLYYGRPLQLKHNAETAFFLSERGSRISGQSMNLRLKTLLDKSGITKENIGLHSLRHSIATHLLQSGMPLKQIAIFLGHESLESTQIYTQIINEIE